MTTTTQGNDPDPGTISEAWADTKRDKVVLRLVQSQDDFWFGMAGSHESIERSMSADVAKRIGRQLIAAANAIDRKQSR